MTADEALARAAGEGIHRLTIPTPFMVGRVNTYLIEGDPLTLVDSGPNSGKALDELHGKLADRGHSIDDIELVIVTHQHIDHIGLVQIVVEHSGAEVAALDAAVPFLERFGEESEADDAYAAELMLRHGIAEGVVEALRSVSRSFRAWGGPVQVTKPLNDGSELELGDRTLRVLHRPGHSPTDTVFWDAERRIAIAGDHLLAEISSNPLITRPAEGEERPQALVAYIESLKRTRAMPAEVVLPGHGDPITEHAALIDDRLRMHARRAEKIHRLIAEQPRSGYEIAQALWGNVAVTQAFLTLSEVLGHVDLLKNDGRVTERDDDGVLRFEAVDGVA